MAGRRSQTTPWSGPRRTRPNRRLERSARTYAPNLVEVEFSEVRIQDSANPQRLLSLDLRQITSIPSDRPQHLAPRIKIHPSAYKRNDLAYPPLRCEQSTWRHLHCSR